MRPTPSPRRHPASPTVFARWPGQRLAWMLVCAAAGVAGCGGRPQSAADGGAQAPTFVKAYSMAGGGLNALASSTAEDGSQYVLAEQPRSPAEGDTPLLLARLDAAGDVMWSRRPEGAVAGSLDEKPLDATGLRLTAPTPDGGAWVIGGGIADGMDGQRPDVRRVHRMAVDGSLQRTLELPDAVRLQAMAPAAGGFVAAGTTALGRARHLWVLHVDAEGRVRTARTVGSLDARTEVTVHSVAYNASAGTWIVHGNQVRLGEPRPQVGPNATWASASEGRFSAGFGADGALLFQAFEGQGQFAGDEVRAVDQSVAVGRGAAGARPDWIVTTLALYTHQRRAHPGPGLIAFGPVGSGLMRLDAATGQRRQAVEPPASAGRGCDYTDLRLIPGGVTGPDRIEVLGVQRAASRACLDRWLRDPASGELAWIGRTWLATPEASPGDAVQARWAPDGRVWVSHARPAGGNARLHRFSVDAPTTPQLSVTVTESSPNDDGYASHVTVLADGDLLLSGGLFGPGAGPSQNQPLLRLRADGSRRWSRTRQDTARFEIGGSVVQALPGGGAVVLSGRTWLRYAADGRLVLARDMGRDHAPGALRRLIPLDRDGDGRDDDVLLLASVGGPGAPADSAVLRLRRLDANGEPVGDDQIVPLGPEEADNWVDSLPRHLELRRAGARRMVAVTRHLKAPPGPVYWTVPLPEHTVVWTDAAGLAANRLQFELAGSPSACGPVPLLRSIATVPHADGRLTLVSTVKPHPASADCLPEAFRRVFWVTELAADGTATGETGLVARLQDLAGTIDLPVSALSADRQPDGGLLLRARWPGSAAEASQADMSDLAPGADFGDNGLASFAPDGRVRWTRSFGGARSESFGETDPWRGAQRDNGALAFGRSDSFATRGSMLAIRTDADGRVGGACAAAREDTAPEFVARWSVAGSGLVSAVRRGPAAATMQPGVAGTVLSRFADSAVTWEVARACSGTSQSPALTVEVVGPGQVDSQPGGIACRAGLDSDCVQSYPAGSAVTLTATAAANARFVAWEGDCASAAGGLAASVTLDTSRRCIARFVDDTPPPPPPSATSCRADAPLAGAWQDATGGGAVPAVPGMTYSLGATLRGGLPLVAVSTTVGSSTAMHRPWVAQWTGTAWSRLGSDADATLPGSVGAMQISADASHVWLAWDYTAFGQGDGVPPSRIEVRRHDGSGWTALPRPVAEASGTLTRWWLLVGADGAPVVAWPDPLRRRVQLLRWSGSAWEPLPALEAPRDGGLWALALDSGGTRIAAVWAAAAGASDMAMQAWTRAVNDPTTAWTARTPGTLPGLGQGEYIANLQALAEGDRIDAALQLSDTSGRPAAAGAFRVARQATADAAWAAFGDTSVLQRAPDFGVRPTGMQLLAGCAGTPWLAWRDDLAYPEARLWAAQSADSAPPSWSALGGQVLEQASVGSAMRVLSAPGGPSWAVVVRATAGSTGSSVLRPELRLRRFEPAGP